MRESSSRTRRVRQTSVKNLSKKQVTDLEKKLYELKEALKRNLREKADFVVNSAHVPENVIKGDDAEVAEKQRMSNAALQEMELIKARLTLVERALMKVESGCYGMCEETDEPIGYERLSALPWARFSVNVQEMREKKQREFKYNRLHAER